MKKQALPTTSKYDLSVGTSHLVRAIKKIYPDISDSEVTTLGNFLLEEIGWRMEAGEQIAFFRKNSDGSVEFTVLGLKILEKKKSLLSPKK
jgi:hypothetical protein